MAFCGNPANARGRALASRHTCLKKGVGIGIGIGITVGAAIGLLLGQKTKTKRSQKMNED